MNQDAPTNTPENPAETPELAGPDLGMLADLAGGDAPQNPEPPRQDIRLRADTVAEYKMILTGTLGPVFQLLAPGWQVQPAEVALLAESWAAVLFKYAPDGLDDLPEITAALATAAIIAPRLLSGQPRKPSPFETQKNPEPAPVAEPQKTPVKPRQTRKNSSAVPA